MADRRRGSPGITSPPTSPGRNCGSALGQLAGHRSSSASNAVGLEGLLLSSRAGGKFFDHPPRPIVRAPHGSYSQSAGSSASQFPATVAANRGSGRVVPGCRPSRPRGPFPAAVAPPPSWPGIEDRYADAFPTPKSPSTCRPDDPRPYDHGHRLIVLMFDFIDSGGMPCTNGSRESSTSVASPVM